MSKSLVRASLELFGYEDNLKRDKKKRKAKSKGVLDLIPINHRTIEKTSKKEALTLKRSNKTTVDDARKRLKEAVDPTEENVKKLLLLNGRGLDQETVDKLVNRALKRSYVPKQSEPAKPETTAFTEEDFRKFEEEYCEL